MGSIALLAVWGGEQLFGKLFSFSFSFRKSDVPELEAISQGVYILPVIILIKHARMTTVCVIAHRSDLAVN